MSINTDYVEQLPAWYRQPLGKALAGLEEQACATALSSLCGYYAVQIGSDALDHCLRHSVMKQSIYMPLSAAQRSEKALIYGDPMALPWQTDSVDLVCLPHTLEGLLQPQQCLAEVVRVLIPQGYILILMFNRYSAWGVSRLLRYGCQQQAPWNGCFVGMMQVRSWLLELDCEIIRTQAIFFRPPLSSSQWLTHLLWLESVGNTMPLCGAGVHLILARKKVMMLTPIKPAWRVNAAAERELSNTTTTMVE